LKVTGCWLLVSGCWFLVSGFWFLISGSWFLVAGKQQAAKITISDELSINAYRNSIFLHINKKIISR